jgi:hypothetical protein
MEMRILDMPVKLWEKCRRVAGDTLFVSYVYQGGYEEKTYKSDGIFKEGDELILGNGK